VNWAFLVLRKVPLLAKKKKKEHYGCSNGPSKRAGALFIPTLKSYAICLSEAAAVQMRREVSMFTHETPH
jgi:hypothetical protein